MGETRPAGDTVADAPLLGAVEAVTDVAVSGWVLRGTPESRAGLQVLLDGSPYGVFQLPAVSTPSPPGTPSDWVNFRIPLPEGARRPAGQKTLVEVRFAEGGNRLHAGARHALPTQRKARALVLIPAGARYEHDKVRLHNWPVAKTIDSYSNIGDLMVYDSTLKLLDYADVEVANIISFTSAEVERYNREFDFAFLRGSNFIHEHMQWERAGELIERLRIPVYAIGVGAQSETRRAIRLPPEGARVWQAIADHCGAIGVRGRFSAETLHLNGVRNVEVVGCPSIFRARDPQLTLRRKFAYDIRKVAFSLRRETGKGYARDIGTYLRTQKEFMLRLATECDITITLHGETEEKAFFFRDLERMTRAVEQLRAIGWFTQDDELRLIDLYRTRLFFNTSVQQYDEFIRTMDLAIGYRVHGVLPALANGVPGMLVDYDERSAELAQTHRVPLLREQDLVGRSWRDLYAPEAFDAFLKAFPGCYATMKAFLDRNGVPNRM